MMVRTLVVAAAALGFASVGNASAQLAPEPRISVEGYLGYNFFGSLPDTNAELEAAVAYGGRAAFQLAPQWAIFGNYQRSNPELTGTFLGIANRSMTVDHWALGVEFSYVPRGGAEGMLPIQIEAGLAQARYEGWDNDLGLKLGLSSALQLSRMFAVRYGIDDYISNFQGDHGVVNHFTARIGAELRF
jgi:hypothetical protein